MHRISLFAAAVTAAVCTHAHAAEKNIPIDFVGDWCSPSRDDDAKSTITYTLPSWTEGACTNILSINKYGFYFTDQKKNCEPVNMWVKENTAHSGTAYLATITAHCQPDGPVTQGVLQTFEFNRYKGHLTLTNNRLSSA